MFASRRSLSTSLLSALLIAASLSCGGDSSTGPSGSVSKVEVTPSTDSLALGSSVTLSASALDGAGHPVSGAKIFWNTENANVATVTSAGIVTGVATGNVRIAASSNGVSGFSNITVIPPGVASVKVTPPSAAIAVDGTVHLQAATLDGSGNPLTGRTVTWSSSDDGVATVDNTGLVTGVTVGAVTITATSEGKSGTAGIAVAAQVAASITVAPPSVSITVGQTSQLTPTVKDASNAIISGAPVNWQVDNSGIASVSPSGLVTGVSPGTATVTATSGAAHTTVSITVAAAPPNAVLVSPSSVSLLITQRQQLTANVTDALGHTIANAPVTWSSSNTAVAAVGSTGLVIAVLPGTATITATSGTVSGTASVTVSLVPVRKVTLAPDALSMIVGDQQSLSLTLQDSADNVLSPTGHTVLWSSSVPGVASVTSAGLVSALTPGASVVSAKVDALTAFSTITVAQVPVATVVVTPALDTLILGGTVQLAAATQDAGGHTLTGRSVSWVSSDESIATVSSTGLVHTFDVGSATITATSEGKVGAATIVVLAVPVATVTVAPTTQTVVIGATTPAFTATTKDGSGNVLSGRVVTWSSGNTGIATIDANSGVATGVAAGTVTITATSEGKTGTAQLTVTPVPVATVAVAPTTQNVDVGSATPAFTATLKDGGGNVLTGRTVTWSSSDPTIATIDASSGIATGVAPGTVTITATSEGKTGTASLTVNPIAVGSVTVAPPSQSIVDGTSTVTSFSATVKDAQNHVLSGRVVTWDSNNHAVATIDNTGKANGLSPGTVTITASSGGKSGTASLTVTPVPVATVAVAPSSQVVVVGSTTPAFTATPKDASGNALTGRVVTWGSSNPAVATVNASGVATGVSAGTVTITATSEGKNGTASLTVSPVPVATVAVAPTTQNVDVGSATPAFSATLKDGSGNVLTGRTVTWSSSDPGTATIDANSGIATGVAPGTVTITATSEGKTGTASLTVNPIAVGSVTVMPPSQSIVDGSSTVTPFSATVKDAQNHVLTGRVVTWGSSNNAVATIDNSGNATGLSPGTVTITATSEGKSGTASLTVTPVPVATVAVAPSSQIVIQGSTTPAFTATPKDASGNALTGRVVTWSSGNDGIATVDASGVATGVTPGTTTIIATSEGKSGSASLTVTIVPVASVTVAPPSQTIVDGATTVTPFTATLRDAGGNVLTGRPLTWSSSDNGIATIDAGGNATGVSPGTVTITANASGVTGTASLEVDQVPVATVAVSPPLGIILLVGGTTQFTAETRDAGNNVLTGRVVTWSSSDETIATVDNTGLVTGTGLGVATITATSEGQVGTASVAVGP